MITKGFTNNTLLTRGIGSWIKRAYREAIRFITKITTKVLYDIKI